MPVGHEKFYGERKTLPIQQTVIVGGQQIHFRQAALFPTVVQLDFEYDAQNEKQIFGIDDLRVGGYRRGRQTNTGERRTKRNKSKGSRSFFILYGCLAVSLFN